MHDSWHSLGAPNKAMADRHSLLGARSEHAAKLRSALLPLLLT